MTTTLLSLLALSSQAVFAERTTKGLQVLYDFQETSGNIVYDTSGVGSPLNLSILSPFDVSLDGERIDINNPTRIEANYVDAKHGDKISQASRTSNELTIEAWINAESVDLFGPARIVTHSSDSSSRDFMLAQDGEKIKVRFSTSNHSQLEHTVDNAFIIPGQIQHLVFTRAANGEASFYLNGKKADQWRWTGDFSSWQKDRMLVIANDYSIDTKAGSLNGRDWQGELYLMAIFSQALTHEQIIANYKAGASSKSVLAIAPTDRFTNASAEGQWAESDIATVEKTITIDNTGLHPLDIKQLSIGGLDLGSFTIVSDDCDQGWVQPNRSCTVTIKLPL